MVHTFNRGEHMKKRKLKKEVVISIYALSFIALIGILYSIEKTLFPVSFDNDDVKYVDKTLFDNVIPVIKEETEIKKPYLDENVKILKYFYDYKAGEEQQENSLIYNDSTYLQSSGVSYGKEDCFDVVSILDGTVIDIKEDSLLGKIIEVRHSNDMISVYQSLGEVNVSLNDIVKQGQVIGKSGTSNIDPTLGNHLHFELMVKGEVVNPEDYYFKKLSDL